MIEDAELLDRRGKGDNTAGRQLYERHYPAIYHFFKSKVTSDIEDLVQDTFAACVAGHVRFRADGSFRAYLFGTARNVLRQRVRRTKVRGHAAELDECSAFDLSPSSSAILADKAEQRLLIEALRRLALDHQIALELYYWESLTANEMAEILGVTERGVRSRIMRAKQQLERRLAELAESPALLESTLTDLDRWARALRGPPCDDDRGLDQ